MPRPTRSNSKTRTRAIELRKEPTPAERKLWAVIRNDQLGVNFRRQHAIGNYIPDFVCIQKNLIIELDGSQHLEQPEYDQERTEYLKSQGYRVIRFWNNDVMKDIDGISYLQSSMRLKMKTKDNLIGCECLLSLQEEFVPSAPLRGSSTSVALTAIVLNARPY